MRVFKHITFFLAAVLMSKGMGFVQSFILARVLGPVNLGIWGGTLMLLVSYSPIVSLGTIETLIKQVPFFLGRREQQRVHEVEGGVLGSILLSAVVVLVAALLVPLFLPAFSLNISSILIVLTLLTIAVNYFSQFFYYRFTAYEDFKAVGTMDFLRAVVALICIGGMAWFWGLWGAVAGYLVHEAVMCLVMTVTNIKSHGAVRMNFRRDLLVGVVRVGFPITLLWWTLTLAGTVDRLVLGGMLGPLAVGYYFFGMSVVGILALVPMVVGRVLYPKVSKHFGQSADLATMKRLILAPTMAMGALIVNVQAVVLLAMPFVYDIVLPKYRPGLLAGQILLLGSFSGCVLRTGANYLIAANHERVFFKYIIATLAINVVSDITLVKCGLGIEGVALGTSLAIMFLTVLVWRRVLQGLGLEPRAAWSAVLGIYLPLILALGVLAGVWLIHPAVFRVFDGSSVLTALVLVLCINGLLCCFSLYRGEMAGWKKELWKIRAAFLNRARQPAVP